MAAIDEGHRALERAHEAYSRADVNGMVAHLSAAIRELTAAGATAAAAMACVELGEVYVNFLGNLVAGRAWFLRARRMIDELPPCIEQGWVALAPIGCDVDDPAELQAAAERALEIARRFGDVNLETKALADCGLAHVQSGRLDIGMALLDEAMALACGPADDERNVARSVCSFYTACYHATDFERAETWDLPLRERGLIATTGFSPLFLSNHCDTVRAALLVELGRWSEAEALLVRAIDEFEQGTHFPSWHPVISLAELRVRQGRLAEAESLLLGKEHHVQALLPAARLHLARGDHQLAATAARRGLRWMGDDRLRAAELLTLLVHAELAGGDVGAARIAADELTARIAGIEVATLHGRAAAAMARVALAEGDPDAAVAALMVGLDRLVDRRLPLLRATLLLELAVVRDAIGDPGAVHDARAAAAILAPLDVVLRDEHAVLLERLCGRESPATAPPAVLRGDGRWWTAAHGGTSVRIPDSKGLRYLAALVEAPGAERHALDLVDRVEGVDGRIDRRRLGDAGPLLDAKARDAYRRRIEQLRADADEALAAGRLETAEAAQDELDQLVRQLAAAFGLGGRARHAGSAAEKARLNVTRALRSATAKLAAALPTAGAALDRQVHTGSYCAYKPVAGDISWIVQS